MKTTAQLALTVKNAHNVVNAKITPSATLKAGNVSANPAGVVSSANDHAKSTLMVMAVL